MPVKGFEAVVRSPYKVGIVASMVFPELTKGGDVVKTLKPIIEDPFFDIIETTPLNEQAWLELKTYLNSIRKTMDLIITLAPMIITGLNPSSTGEFERKESEDALVKAVELAGVRRAYAVSICSGPYVEDKEKASQAFVKTLNALAQKASKHNVLIFVEAFDTAWGRRRLLGPMKFSTKVIEKVRENYNNVYLLWDLSHAPLLNERPEVLKSYVDLIGHIHVGCAKNVNGTLYD